RSISGGGPAAASASAASSSSGPQRQARAAVLATYCGSDRYEAVRLEATSMSSWSTPCSRAMPTASATSTRLVFWKEAYDSFNADAFPTSVPNTAVRTAVPTNRASMRSVASAGPERYRVGVLPPTGGEPTTPPSTTVTCGASSAAIRCARPGLMAFASTYTPPKRCPATSRARSSAAAGGQRLMTMSLRSSSSYSVATGVRPNWSARAADAVLRSASHHRTAAALVAAQAATAAPMLPGWRMPTVGWSTVLLRLCEQDGDGVGDVVDDVVRGG